MSATFDWKCAECHETYAVPIGTVAATCPYCGCEPSATSAIVVAKDYGTVLARRKRRQALVAVLVVGGFVLAYSASIIVLSQFEGSPEERARDRLLSERAPDADQYRQADEPDRAARNAVREHILYSEIGRDFEERRWWPVRTLDPWRTEIVPIVRREIERQRMEQRSASDQSLELLDALETGTPQVRAVRFVYATRFHGVLVPRDHVFLLSRRRAAFANSEVEAFCSAKVFPTPDANRD